MSYNERMQMRTKQILNCEWLIDWYSLLWENAIKASPIFLKQPQKQKQKQNLHTTSVSPNFQHLHTCCSVNNNICYTHYINQISPKNCKNESNVTCTCGAGTSTSSHNHGFFTRTRFLAILPQSSHHKSQCFLSLKWESKKPDSIR